MSKERKLQMATRSIQTLESRAIRAGDPTSLGNIVSSALNAQYKPTVEEAEDVNCSYLGMTTLEVTIYKAAQRAAQAGDFKAMDSLISRGVGKPLNVSINKNTAGLGDNPEAKEQWLAEIARIEQAENI